MSSTKTGRLPFICRRLVQRRPEWVGVGQLEQVGEQRLLVVEVQDGVADHRRILPVQDPARDDPMVPVYGW